MKYKLSYLKILYNRAYDKLFGDVNLNSLIICRIVFGFCIFFEYILSYRLIPEIFAPDGFPRIQTKYGNYLFFIKMNFFEFTPIEIIWVCYFLLLVFSLFYAIGFKTKISGIMMLILHSLFVSRNEIAFWGWASLIKPLIFYTLFAPIDKAYSVDALLKKSKIKNIFGPAWPKYLVGLNICTMYLVAGWARIKNISWVKGEMLYAVFISRMFSRFDLDVVALKPVLEVFQYLMFIVEPLAPFALWTKTFRIYFTLILISMHLLLEIFGTVGSWNYMMIAALTTFLPVHFLTIKDKKNGE